MLLQLPITSLEEEEDCEEEEAGGVGMMVVLVVSTLAVPCSELRWVSIPCDTVEECRSVHKHLAMSGEEWGVKIRCGARPNRKVMITSRYSLVVHEAKNLVLIADLLM